VRAHQDRDQGLGLRIDQSQRGYLGRMAVEHRYVLWSVSHENIMRGQMGGQFTGRPAGADRLVPGAVVTHPD